MGNVRGQYARGQARCPASLEERGRFWVYGVAGRRFSWQIEVSGRSGETEDL